MRSAPMLAMLLLLATAFPNSNARTIFNPSDTLQFLERYNDPLTLDDINDLVENPAETVQPFKLTEYPRWTDVGVEENPWLRLLRAAVLTSGKRLPTDRTKRGWNRGCFGLKLDRIGSMSGLGC